MDGESCMVLRLTLRRSLAKPCRELRVEVFWQVMDASNFVHSFKNYVCHNLWVLYQYQWWSQHWEGPLSVRLPHLLFSREPPFYLWFCPGYSRCEIYEYFIGSNNPNELLSFIHGLGRFLSFRITNNKLDGVCPVDNRPSTDLLYNLVQNH